MYINHGVLWLRDEFYFYFFLFSLHVVRIVSALYVSVRAWACRSEGRARPSR